MILKVKGRKALIDLEGASAELGDRFNALNLYGKPLGLLEIKKVKRGKAIAVLRKGKMKVNWILEPADDTPAEAPPAAADYNPPPSFAAPARHTQPAKKYKPPRSSFNTVGFSLGPYLNWVRISSSTKISGWSWQAGGTLDFFFTNYLSARINLGYQTLQAAGTDCGNITRCNLSLHYPGAGILLRGVFLKNYLFRPWIGGGGALFWPIVDKDRDLSLDKKSFDGFHGALIGALGVDIHLKKIYLPIQLEVGWINPVLISFRSLKEGTREFKPIYAGFKFGVGFYF